MGQDPSPSQHPRTSTFRLSPPACRVWWAVLYSLTVRSKSSENIPSRNRDCTGCRHPSPPAVVNLETRITCVVERRCQFRMAVLRRPRSLGRRRDTWGRFIFPTPPEPFIIGTGGGKGFAFQSGAIRMNSGVVGLGKKKPFRLLSIERSNLQDLRGGVSEHHPGRSESGRIVRS